MHTCPAFETESTTFRPLPRRGIEGPDLTELGKEEAMRPGRVTCHVADSRTGTNKGCTLQPGHRKTCGATGLLRHGTELCKEVMSSLPLESSRVSPPSPERHGRLG